VKLFALKFVRFERIEDHFRQGWIVSFANAPMHHHHYGVELAWICSCPVPGGFKYDRVNRVPASQTEMNANGTEHRT
jgi:hypothetical protein